MGFCKGLHWQEKGIILALRSVVYCNKKQPPKPSSLANTIGQNRNYCPEYWLHFFSLSSMRRSACQVRPRADTLHDFAIRFTSSTKTAPKVRSAFHPALHQLIWSTMENLSQPWRSRSVSLGCTKCVYGAVDMEEGDSAMPGFAPVEMKPSLGTHSRSTPTSLAMPPCPSAS